MSYIWQLFHNTYSAKSHINADKTILHDRGRYFKRMVKGIKDPAAHYPIVLAVIVRIETYS
jgi:hypothetical protein